MLIIEGTDLVGKTSLVNVLVERLQKHGSWIPCHLTKPPDNFRAADYIPRMSLRVVQDRFHMSEVAYSRACNRESKLTPFEYSLIDARLRQLGGFTVVILGTDLCLEHRNQELDREEMYGLNTIQAANLEFKLLITVAAGKDSFFPDIDMVVQSNLFVGCPSKQTDVVDEIVTRYIERQLELENFEKQSRERYRA